MSGRPRGAVAVAMGLVLAAGAGCAPGPAAASASTPTSAPASAPPPPPAPAEGPKLSGWLETAALRSRIEPTWLAPDPEARGFVDDQRLGVLVLGLRYDRGPFRLSGQGRLALGSDDRAPNARVPDDAALLDELFVEGAPGDGAALFAGRRNLSFGQAFGINPADVFLDEALLDRRLPPDRRRAEIEGLDLLGFERFSPDGGGSLLGFWAPERGGGDRAYLSWRTLVGASLADLGVFVFDDVRPGIGLSVAAPTASGTLPYADVVLRRGRPLPPVRAAAGPQAAIGPRDADARVLEATLGLGRTWSGGLTLNAEYTRLSGGYSGAEWAAFRDAVALVGPPASPAEGAVLAKLGAIAEAPWLRRNYGFVRLHRPGVAGSGIEAEWTALLGLDDGSGSVGLRLSREFRDVFRAGLSLGRTFGGSGDEFRRGPERGYLGLSLETRL